MYDGAVLYTTVSNVQRKPTNINENRRKSTRHRIHNETNSASRVVASETANLIICLATARYRFVSFYDTGCKHGSSVSQLAHSTYTHRV